MTAPTTTPQNRHPIPSYTIYNGISLSSSPNHLVFPIARISQRGPVALALGTFPTLAAAKSHLQEIRDDHDPLAVAPLSRFTGVPDGAYRPWDAELGFAVPRQGTGEGRYIFDVYWVTERVRFVGY